MLVHFLMWTSSWNIATLNEKPRPARAPQHDCRLWSLIQPVTDIVRIRSTVVTTRPPDYFSRGRTGENCMLQTYPCPPMAPRQTLRLGSISAGCRASTVPPRKAKKSNLVTS